MRFMHLLGVLRTICADPDPDQVCFGTKIYQPTSSLCLSVFASCAATILVNFLYIADILLNFTGDNSVGQLWQEG